MPIHYCPRCWQEVSPEQTVCGACGAALRETDRDLVQRYIDALRHPEPTLACLACAMLAELQDRRAVAPLMALVESRPVYEVTCAAAESLAQLGDPAAIPVLWALMQDSNAMIPGRVAALRALTHFDADTARAALAWAATCERPALRDEAEALNLRARAGL